MTARPPPRVLDPARLAALRRVGALELSGDPALERISRLATALLGTPVSLVSMVDADRQVFVAQVGLEEPWAGRGETPLSHSFCQHVVADDSALVVPDARQDVRLRDNLAIEDLDVVAYCGVPLRSPGGHVLGSFCVIDSDPREWTPEEIALVEDLGALAQEELARRSPDTDHAIAHDLRSALHGVVGGVRTIARAGALDDDLRAELSAVVERQAGHLEQLVELLLLDGGAAERLAMATEEVDVMPLLDDVVGGYRLGGTTRVSLTTSGSPRARADRTALRRCLTNLIDNALKHGGPDVAVDVTATAVDGVVQVTVADDGHGIPVAEQDAVFADGRRGTTTAAPGSGIGLATVRRLARAMGGDVHVASATGAGATFTVTLPAA